MFHYSETEQLHLWAAEEHQPATVCFTEIHAQFLSTEEMHMRLKAEVIAEAVNLNTQPGNKAQTSADWLKVKAKHIASCL